MSANGPMNDITKSPLWSRLDAERDAVASTSLAAMFAADPGRTETLTQEFDGISVDLSRQRLRPETLSLLIDLAR
jgi:glucose-6-phosphate isomerase